MKKLESREDIEHLVNSFYAKVIKDETIGFFFTDIAKVQWDKHLPKMYSFWESILFGQMTYKGNPMGAHFPINELQAMEQKHFDRWLELWKKPLKKILQVNMPTWLFTNLKILPGLWPLKWILRDVCNLKVSSKLTEQSP